MEKREPHGDLNQLSQYGRSIKEGPQPWSIDTLKHEVQLNTFYKFSSYRKENTMRLHDKEQPVRKIIAIYSENHT
jgi:hypothetical protein